MADRMDVLEGPVRESGPENPFDARPFLGRSLDELARPGTIVGMDALEEFFERRNVPFGIEAEQAEQFLRCVDHPPGGDVRRPAARPRQPLRFSQVRLAPAHGLFGAGEVLDPRRQIVVRLLERCLGAALCPGEPGDEQCRDREDDEVQRVVERDGAQVVRRHHDEIIDGQDREADGEQTGADPAVPGAHHDRGNERCAANPWPVQRHRGEQRQTDARDCHPVFRGPRERSVCRSEASPNGCAHLHSLRPHSGAWAASGNGSPLPVPWAPAGRTLSTCGSRAPLARSKSTNSIGMTKIAIAVPASMPEMTPVPRIRLETAPAPEATQSANRPKMKANEVMSTGRKRSLAPSSAASRSDLPFSSSPLANSTMRMAFFADRPTSITSPIWL